MTISIKKGEIMFEHYNARAKFGSGNIVTYTA